MCVWWVCHSPTCRCACVVGVSFTHLQVCVCVVGVSFTHLQVCVHSWSVRGVQSHFLHSEVTHSPHRHWGEHNSDITSPPLSALVRLPLRYDWIQHGCHCLPIKRMQRSPLPVSSQPLSLSNTPCWGMFCLLSPSNNLRLSLAPPSTIHACQLSYLSSHDSHLALSSSM